ncbi:MAG: ribosome maturation factor RimP [Clostridiales bacterium]|jgi:ribosome maturation factor RimP|nr:ribosome maturation factor RimP [Clostridiales bacterium]
MASNNIVSEVRELIAPVFMNSPCELYDIVFVKEGSSWCLRVFIDKDGGVAINDCEQISRAIEKILDDKDPIERSYTLEVSSPGIDRPLKKDSDFEKNIGRQVELRLYKPIGKKKEFIGKLQGLIDGSISIIDSEGAALSFPKSDVSLCRLHIVF